MAKPSATTSVILFAIVRSLRGCSATRFRCSAVGDPGACPRRVAGLVPEGHREYPGAEARPCRPDPGYRIRREEAELRVNACATPSRPGRSSPVATPARRVPYRPPGPGRRTGNLRFHGSEWRRTDAELVDRDGRAAAPCPRAHRRRARRGGEHPGPCAQPPGAGAVRRHVERALLLQVVAHPPAAPPDRRPPRAGGAGGERRGDRRRRRDRRGHPHRVPQPPVGHRALPGGGHRGRAASSATSSPWARGRSPSWTRSSSATRPRPGSSG